MITNPDLQNNEVWDVYFDEVGSWKELQSKYKIISNIQLEWEDADSRVETQYEAANNEAQRVAGRPTRERQAPSRFRDYQIYYGGTILEEGDLVQHMALMGDMEPISFEEVISKEVGRLEMEEELKSIEKNDTWEMVNLLV
ncbi:hypothetical protein KIW84_046257 [Lathyrus oleraceus]|uniref:Uncharacterized protein n=1 Tax=Pisum sativum TaxID=3888 RepID=A0A9D4XLG7_PEA|nr:hypothetical protein KIW84_046257 [Pisum sativum]